ncbi:hypothetical protein PR202_ga26031 [Eleusine coracana subsp. coracana]|uniref:Laccase n=1 Tax=Eleusine coracana subsp. coracana TaxID=191504 RepID=A0AAV5DBQ5_ELECO|nr:hypothetical protein PR202_ga26031 [Eleusine coracana subsp. coracana]
MAGMARPVGSFAALLLLLLSCSLLPSALAEKRFYEFVVKETPVKRLCMTQHVITVNDMCSRGRDDREVYNGDDALAISRRSTTRSIHVTLHWHGLRQMRNGWADGRWWKRDPIAVLRQSRITGAPPNVSDTFMINGQPGDFLPCSSQETSIIPVVAGETSLLRVINAAMNAELFVSLAGHKIDVVAADAPTHYKNVPGGCSAATLGPKGPAGLSRASSGHHHHHPPGHSKGPAPMLPFLPAYNDTKTATVFSDSIRSPAPVKVPHPVTQEVFTTIGFGLFSCRPGPLPNTISLLQAHYHHLPDVFTLDFPPRPPPLVFNFTSTNIPRAHVAARGAPRELYRVKYGAVVVQIVFQDTGIFVAEEHPMHIHGYHFYVLATGFGNYDPRRDEAKFNLVDPPSRNTIGVPVGGWAVVRFVADNPGVWLVHCHIDAHLTGGLAMALVVEDGKTELEATMPPPYDLPVCPHH